MGRSFSHDSRSLHATSSYPRAALENSRITAWFQRIRDRLTPTAYLDWSDLPDEPESPYRARLTVRKEDVPDEVEVGTREVVPGEMKVVYEIRCRCGKRWFNPRRENVQICPRCDRAVLLRDPD